MVILVLVIGNVPRGGGSVRWSGKSPNSTAVLHLDGHLALHRQRDAKFHHLRGRYQTGPTDGQAVVLIHGLTDNLRSWSTTMQSLHWIDPELHILAIDLRGHGRSSMPDPKSCAPAPEACFRIGDFAGDVVAFMTAEGISTATLAGHSLGSFIVQEVALTHPEMVDRAILDATAASGRGNAVLEDYVLKEPLEGSWKAALEADGKTYPQDVYEATPLEADPDVETWLAKNWVFDPTANPAFMEPYLPETANVRLGTWIGATKALLDYDNTDRLKNLSVPTLVMWGTQDSIFSAADQDVLKAVLATAATRQGGRSTGSNTGRFRYRHPGLRRAMSGITCSGRHSRLSRKISMPSSGLESRRWTSCEVILRLTRRRCWSSRGRPLSRRSEDSSSWPTRVSEIT